MKKVKVMVLAGEGINCENETALAFERSGAQADIIYFQEWMRQPSLLQNYQILVFPGGFSYGDELHSGQIMALDLKYHLNDSFKHFMNRKGLVLGVCNGFQILMKWGVFENQAERTMTLFHNASFQFQNRWVSCDVPSSHCIWTQHLTKINLPARHGEGRLIFKGDEEEQKILFEKLSMQKQIALIYTEDFNGSYGNIAGITDASGQILGLMPHPEAALDSFLYPYGYEQDPQLAATLFKNAISFAQEQL